MDQNLEKLVELLEKDREIFQMLRQCPYEILRRFEVKDYEADQFVLNQGEIHNRFYIIASGYGDIYVESAHGKRYLLCTYMKGDYIGELEIFKQTGYISRIQSRGKVRILELDRTFFLQWIRTDKNFNEYMIRTLCDNSYRMCLNMGENTLYTLKQRICQYLLRNMEMDAKFVMISSEVLSQQMAVTTRSVNRVLKQLREQGFIELEKGKISICDQQALEDILRKD
mgnify:FL=1